MYVTYFYRVIQNEIKEMRIERRIQEFDNLMEAPYSKCHLFNEIHYIDDILYIYKKKHLFKLKLNEMRNQLCIYG